jgi:hypothetical protein
MLSGVIGVSSPGQFAPGAISSINSPSPANLLPAPFDRTFVVPQNGLPWEGEKTPESSVNFSFNWAGEIGDDPIIKSVWELESPDVVNQLNNIDSTATITTILLSNGVSANIYNVTNFITTQSGLQLDATFRLFVNPYNW